MPVTVIMTHGDRDHTGGLHDFGSCYLHQNDWHLVQQDGVRLLPLREGDVFCCGAYRLETVEIPGHTYGSVAFFDREQRLLFPGDSVQKGGPIYMFGSHRNLPRYIESLRKLSGWADKVDTLLPATTPVRSIPAIWKRIWRMRSRFRRAGCPAKSIRSWPASPIRGDGPRFMRNVPKKQKHPAMRISDPHGGMFFRARPARQSFSKSR